MLAGIKTAIVGFRNASDVVILREENAKLQTENAELKFKVADLERILATFRSDENYVMEDGAKWKRGPSGNLTDGPRCPHCMDLMSSNGQIIFCTRDDYQRDLGPPPAQFGYLPDGF